MVAQKRGVKSPQMGMVVGGAQIWGLFQMWPYHGGRVWPRSDFNVTPEYGWSFRQTERMSAGGALINILYNNILKPCGQPVGRNSY